MPFLQLIVELFQRLQIFDDHPHLFDALASAATLKFWLGIAHLAHLQVPLSQLLEHILRTERIVQLQLEVLDLRLGIPQPGFGKLAATCSQLMPSR